MKNIILIVLLVLIIGCELHHLEWQSPFGEIKIERIDFSTVSGPSSNIVIPKWKIEPPIQSLSVDDEATQAFRDHLREYMRGQLGEK